MSQLIPTIFSWIISVKNHYFPLWSSVKADRPNQCLAGIHSSSLHNTWLLLMHCCKEWCIFQQNLCPLKKTQKPMIRISINKHLHLDLFSTLWEDFRLHLGLALALSLAIWKAKAKIWSTFTFDFFSNFGHFIGPFNPVFHFHFKNIYIFFLNWTKIDIFSDCYFLELFFWRRNSFFLRK